MSARLLAWLAAAWLAAASLAAAPPSDGGAARPYARERLLLATKVEVKRVFPQIALTGADLDAIDADDSEATARADAGDTAGELLARSRAVRRAEGWPDDAWSDVAFALRPRLSTPLASDAEEGDAAAAVTLSFEWLVAPARLPEAPCTLQVALAKGTPYGAGGVLQRVATLATVAAVRFDAARPPAQVELAIPARHVGSYFVQAWLERDDGKTTPLAHPCRFARQPGLRAEVAALETRRRALAAARPAADRATAAALALAELPASLLAQVEAGERQLQESLLDVEVGRATELLDAIERGAPPPIDRGLVRRVQRLASTGELLPWLLYLPAAVAAAPREPRPLIVALHGLGAREESWFQYGNGALAREAEARGAIVAVPHGWRVDSFYVGPGEEDVLGVIDAVLAEQPVDRDRVVLIGHSMGAFGTLRLGARHPDRFAALGAFAGGGRPAWIEPARDVPAFLVHGDTDGVVPVALSRTLAALAATRAPAWRYREIAGADHLSVVATALPEVLDFCLAARRKAR